eukprot:COSAG05_NODE_55_length_23493_cov_709.337907_10_plen_79_part_00
MAHLDMTIDGFSWAVEVVLKRSAGFLTNTLPININYSARHFRCIAPIVSRCQANSALGCGDNGKHVSLHALWMKGSSN